MKLVVKIDAEKAHKDYELLKQFKELISDFDRLKSVVFYNEVLNEFDYGIPEEILNYWKNRDEECKKQCSKEDNDEKSGKDKSEGKESNDFDSFKEMLRDLLI